MGNRLPSTLLIVVLVLIGQFSCSWASNNTTAAPSAAVDGASSQKISLIVCVVLFASIMSVFGSNNTTAAPSAAVDEAIFQRPGLLFAVGLVLIAMMGIH